MIESTDALLAVLGILVTAVGSFYALRLTWRRDKVAKEAGIETLRSGSIQTAIDGFTSLVSSLQEDNRELRVEQSDLERKMVNEAEKCRLQIEALAARLATLTPPGGTPA